MERRNAIRLSWSKIREYQGHRQEVVFIIGRTARDDIQLKIEEENTKYGDVLQFNLHDNKE